MLEFLKNGSGIHIKESQKGTFTKYCGGNVTDECIKKGKNSPNPKIRKKATFADNARHFKHQQGGIIKSQEGSKVNWGELAVNTGTNLLSTISKNKQTSYNAQAKKAQNQINYDSFIQEATNNAIQKTNQLKEQWKQSYLNGDTLDRSFESEAVIGNLQHQFIAPEIVKGKQALNTVNTQAEAEANAQKANNWSNTFEDIISNGLGNLNTYLGQKKDNSSTINDVSFFTTTKPKTNSAEYNMFTKNSVLNDPNKFWSL